ncbi:hypothetical protein GCM10022243_06590 [Saccharothrix violaceirubra]|uniref:Uncharacterized protein n=1 Tax=Saccharothrix violaceirubra TaxID=413306 RepID=A0A7W7SYK5_9PSEU|nr:DUF6461 domain-containing protein [Saccharothrix violaceirubra]MBB4963071.1 hypothetical protein [Saccharothrix violaceirubra]
MDDATDHYADLLDNGPLPDEALCLTAVRGFSVDEALRRFDGFPSARTETLADAGRTSVDAFPDLLPLVVADEVDGWVLLAEDNGWHGSSAEMLARLSKGTVAASAYWNVDFDSSLTLAIDGRVHECDFISEHESDDPALAPFLAGLPFDDAERMCAASLAFVERVSGVRVTDEWVRAPHPVSVVASAHRFVASAGWIEANAPELVGLDIGPGIAARVAGEGSRVEWHRQALETLWARCLPVDPDGDRVARLQAHVRQRDADRGPEQRLSALAHAAAAREALDAGDLDSALFNACCADPGGWEGLRESLRN